MARYPDMRFDVELSDRSVDLVDEGSMPRCASVAIGGQNLVGRKVGVTQLVCCAAPAYVARFGEPRTPEDLARHACLLYAYAAQRDVWTFTDGTGRERKVRVAGPVHSNNGSFAQALAVEGIGIAFEPDFIVGDDVRSGRLLPILRGFTPPSTGINVVYASRRHLSAQGARVRGIPGRTLRAAGVDAGAEVAACLASGCARKALAAKGVRLADYSSLAPEILASCLYFSRSAFITRGILRTWRAPARSPVRAAVPSRPVR